MNTKADLAAAISYIVSIGLALFSSLLNFLDAHTGAIGSMVAISTFIVNCHYQRKRYKLIELSKDEESRDDK